MLKSLIGHGHVDFGTNQQQDAQEYFLHIMELLEQQDSKKLKELFEFQVCFIQIIFLMLMITVLTKR